MSVLYCDVATAATMFITNRLRILTRVTFRPGLSFLALVVVGCHGITDAGNNGIIGPSQFDTPSGAVLRRNEAVASFAVAQSDQVAWSGLMADELTAYLNQANQDADARRITPDNQPGGGSSYPYDELTNARINALRAIATLERYNPYPSSRIGELFALVGFTELYLAENMCSGVPLASVAGGVPVATAVLTRDSLVSRSLADFDSATAYSSDSGVVQAQPAQLAAVGKGRALLYSGRFVEAAQAVGNVAPGFAYLSAIDGQLQFNSPAQHILSYEDMSVADREGINGLDFISATDPRVLTATTGAVITGRSIYNYAPYSPSTPLIVASGIEARLIRAEAAWQNGDVGAWADTLNAMRSSFVDTALSNHPLPTDSTTNASADLQVGVMFRERAFWLFLTGHRHADLRRLIRQYSRQANAVFPTGPYSGLGGLPYGSDVNFVPFGETNDQQFHGCIDRSA